MYFVVFFQDGDWLTPTLTVFTVFHFYFLHRTFYFDISISKVLTHPSPIEIFVVIAVLKQQATVPISHVELWCVYQLKNYCGQ